MEHSTWHRLLKEELPNHYFSKINQFMDKVYEEGTIYPPRDKVFNALLETPFEEVRVVILAMVLIRLRVCHFQYLRRFQLHLLWLIFSKNWGRILVLEVIMI